MNLKMEEIERVLGYIFKDKNLLRFVFIYKLVIYSNKNCYERFEFFGDVVLEFVVSKYLFVYFFEFFEGEFINIRVVVVCS